MSAITLLVNHIDPTNKRKSDLMKAATRLLEEIMSKSSDIQIIIIENNSNKRPALPHNI